jgi:hypothetical protein
MAFAESPHRALRAVPVSTCAICKIAAARVDGLVDAWRPESPDLMDVLADDALARLMDKRMWDMAPGDPAGQFGVM